MLDDQEAMFDDKEAMFDDQEAMCVPMHFKVTATARFGCDNCTTVLFRKEESSLIRCFMIVFLQKIDTILYYISVKQSTLWFSNHDITI